MCFYWHYGRIWKEIHTKTVEFQGRQEEYFYNSEFVFIQPNNSHQSIEHFGSVMLRRSLKCNHGDESIVIRDAGSLTGDSVHCCK